MRLITPAGDFRARVIAGTHTVLVALTCEEPLREGLLGFAFKREIVNGANIGPKWLRSLKVFKSVVPDPSAIDPVTGKRLQFSTWEHPIQSFLWSDYTAKPNTRYKFTIVPMYGQPGALQPRQGLSFEVKTEKEFDKGHGIWFNRGAIASQAFADRFENKPPEDPNNPKDEETEWLSRGLLHACLNFINETPKSDALRVAAYEFTYKPVLDALKAALDRGVDVRILYHDTSKSSGAEKGANETAIAAAALPKKKGNRKVFTRGPKRKFHTTNSLCDSRVAQNRK